MGHIVQESGREYIMNLVDGAVRKFRKKFSKESLWQMNSGYVLVSTISAEDGDNITAGKYDISICEKDSQDC